MPITQTPFTLFEKFEKGQKRSLRFDVNALADFEQEFGMGISQLMQSKAVWAATRALTWAGLKWEDPGLTIADVGTLMGLYIRGGGNVNDILMEAMAACSEQGAFGEPDEDNAGKIRGGRAKAAARLALTEAPADSAAPTTLPGVLVTDSGDRG